VVDGVEVIRFRYMLPEGLEALAYGGGMVANVRRRPWLLCLVPFFLAAQIRVLRRLAPGADVVATHWLFPQGMAARLGGVFPVVILHGSDVHLVGGRGGAARFLARWTLSGASGVVANSAATARRAEDLSPGARVQVIPMGVDVERFSSTGGGPKERAGAVPPRIISVGRLIPLKGYRYLIEAMPKIREGLPGATLTLVGDGPEWEGLARLAKDLGVGDAVTFTGEVPHADVPGILTGHDLFVLPAVVTETGETEGLGTVMLEAMAAGLPVAASDVGGIPDVVEHEVTGLLFPPGNPDAVGDAVIRMISDDGLRGRVAAEAEKRVRERFSWPVIAKKYEELFIHLREQDRHT
jgi:glycosyltransferase involved in cell wall biosynthesis